MRISDAERGAICLLNVTAELHQRFTSVNQTTAEANSLSHGQTSPRFTITFEGPVCKIYRDLLAEYGANGM